MPNSPPGWGDQPSFQTYRHTAVKHMYMCILVSKLERQFLPHTDQWRHPGVAVDQRQSGQANDNVAQCWSDKSREYGVSMVTQGKDALQAFHQLCHDLTCFPLTHVCNTRNMALCVP